MQNLTRQCQNMDIPILDAIGTAQDLRSAYTWVLDAICASVVRCQIMDIVTCGSYSCAVGFSFQGAVRAPFDHILATIREAATPVCAVDIPSGGHTAVQCPVSGLLQWKTKPCVYMHPSGWDVEKGNTRGNGLEPKMLVSLTAPKLCAKTFSGIHYIGGRCGSDVGYFTLVLQ